MNELHEKGRRDSVRVFQSEPRAVTSHRTADGRVRRRQRAEVMARAGTMTETRSAGVYESGGGVEYRVT